MRLTYLCPNCNHSQYLEITLPTPAKLSGPPELCCPAEDGGYDPEACEKCGLVFDSDDVWGKIIEAAKEVQDYDDAAHEDYYDWRD